MFELLHRARWDQAFNFLAAGDPPMIFRLLAINTLFLMFYVIRRAKVKQRMRDSTVMQVQVLLVLANVMILMQSDIQMQLTRIIARI